MWVAILLLAPLAAGAPSPDPSSSAPRAKREGREAVRPLEAPVRRAATSSSSAASPEGVFGGAGGVLVGTSSSESGRRRPFLPSLAGLGRALEPQETGPEKWAVDETEDPLDRALRLLARPPSRPGSRTATVSRSDEPFRKRAPSASASTCLGCDREERAPEQAVVAAGRAARTLGMAGESCRAARDCHPDLRCRDHVCVPAPRPKPDEAPPKETPPPKTRLRAGIELSPGLGLVRADRVNLVGDARPTRSERARFIASAHPFVELGLDEDQLLLGVAGGPAWPAGTDRGDPSLLLELRAGWRVWRGSPSVGLYVEPRLQGYAGNLPETLGLGGALAGRFRLHWLDAGLLLGGFATQEGLVRISELTAVREQIAALQASLFIALSPTLIAW